MEKDETGMPDILVNGERRDSEYFEEGLVDAAWIPAGYDWQSLGVLRERVDELEEEAHVKLGLKKD